MMTRWTLCLPVLAITLGACQPAPAEPEDPTLTACGADAQQALIGQDKSVLAAMTLPAPTRVIEAGMAVTMDFLQTRLNIWIGEDDKIARVTCG
jgi:Peptidase inhibitor I78 family